MTTAMVDELTSLINTTLESRGILASIRAQLRKEVFTAIRETDTKHTTTQQQIDNIQATTTDSLLFALVHEYLLFYKMRFTANMLINEGTKNAQQPDNRMKLVQQLQLNSADSSKPLLHSLLSTTIQPKPSHITPTHSTAQSPAISPKPQPDTTTLSATDKSSATSTPAPLNTAFVNETSGMQTSTNVTPTAESIKQDTIASVRSTTDTGEPESPTSPPAAVTASTSLLSSLPPLQSKALPKLGPLTSLTDNKSSLAPLTKLSSSSIVPHTTSADDADIEFGDDDDDDDDDEAHETQTRLARTDKAAAALIATDSLSASLSVDDVDEKIRELEQSRAEREVQARKQLQQQQPDEYQDSYADEFEDEASVAAAASTIPTTEVSVGVDQSVPIVDHPVSEGPVEEELEIEVEEEF